MHGVVAIFGLVCLLSGCTRSRQEVVVFHAASLSRALSDVADLMKNREPDILLRLEPSGSQVAARKLTELNRHADLVLSADYRVIDQLLVPQVASFNLLFATNEIVLAHGEHSLHTAEINQDNWPAVLRDPQVRLARANEQTAPIGYQTLVVLKLVERAYPPEVATDLSAQLVTKIPAERVVQDVEELAALLESRTIDYAFVYRSVAEEHNLKITALPDTCNLGRTEQATAYAQVEIDLPAAKNGAATVKKIKGEPILYGLTIPINAPNPAGAARVVRFLLGPEGKKALLRSGLRLLEPARCKTPENLPDVLRPLIKTR